jgi:membrane protein
MPITLPQRAHYLLDGPRFYVSGLARRLINEPVFIWAQAIAFKVLITLFPVILIATGIFGLVLRQENPFEAVADYVRTFLPPGQSEPLIDLLFRLQEASPALTIIGGVIFVLTVVTLFSVLRYVVGTAMGSGRHRYRSLLYGYLFDARMAVQVGLLFLLSFAMTLGVSYLNTAGQEVLVGWGLDPLLLARGQRIFLRTASFVLPFLLSLAMFAQLYYFIPRPRPPSRSVLFGASFTALMFEVAKTGFALYATYLGRFDRFIAGDEALSSVFWLLILFVVWVYSSGLVFIVGAMMVNLHEQRNQPERGRLRGFVRKYLFRKRHAPRPVGSYDQAETGTGRPGTNGRKEPGGRGADTVSAPRAADANDAGTGVPPAAPGPPTDR